MPQSIRRLRERRKETARRARAMESDEARAARLTRDATQIFCTNVWARTYGHALTGAH